MYEEGRGARVLSSWRSRSSSQLVPQRPAPVFLCSIFPIFPLVPSFLLSLLLTFLPPPPAPTPAFFLSLCSLGCLWTCSSPASHLCSAGLKSIHYHALLFSAVWHQLRVQPKGVSLTYSVSVEQSSLENGVGWPLTNVRT